MHVQADIEHARSRFFSQHSPTGEQHARATTCDADHKADVEVAAQMHLRRPATRQPSHNPPNPRSVTRLQATLERATEELAQLRRSTPRPLHRSPASSDSLSCNAPPAMTRRERFFMMVTTSCMDKTSPELSIVSHYSLMVSTASRSCLMVFPSCMHQNYLKLSVVSPSSLIVSTSCKYQYS